jgi:GTPase involved in cell partitioning and DNA repair
MIPFTRAAVPVVDVAAGRAVVADLPGLLEDAGADEGNGNG